MLCSMASKQASEPFDRLSDDMIETINAEIRRIAREHGFGELTLRIEEGVPKYLLPAPSIPLRPAVNIRS